jgi:uncharacterized BrkB/YihY/UPF0761 family membrane protein
MKKIIFLIISILAIITPLAEAKALNLGLDMAGNVANTAGYGATNEYTLAQKIGLGVQVAMSFLGIIFTVLMVYAGFLWMTARGDDAKVDKSKNIITAAIIGLIITLASYSISYYVTRSFFSGA